MKFNVLTIFPDLFTSFSNTGVVGKALKKDISSLNIINPRDFAEDKHQSVDSPPYGGGDGMLMKFEPLQKAVESLKSSGELGKVVSLSPQGELWSNALAKSWAESSENITLVCGRYAGIDQRFTNAYVDTEISIGDYIISGAEIAAQVLIDSTMRFIPGVLGHSDSAVKESFNQGLLEAPQYTQPFSVNDLYVPEVLASGHHKNIEQWKKNVSIVRTKILRPDLINLSSITPSEIKDAFEFVSNLSDREVGALGLTKQQIREGC